MPVARLLFWSMILSWSLCALLFTLSIALSQIVHSTFPLGMFYWGIYSFFGALLTSALYAFARFVLTTDAHHRSSDANSSNSP